VREEYQKRDFYGTAEAVPFQNVAEIDFFSSGKAVPFQTILRRRRSMSIAPSYLVAHIDGGARGNPGHAGYGVALEDEARRPVAQLSEYLGYQTNNYAEYSGLLGALSYALEHGFKALKVFSDSELMVKQIKGQYKVNHPTLKDLHEKATRMIQQLEAFEISHVLREKNQDADRLANQAMDRGMKRGARSVTRAGPVSSDSAAREVNGIVRNGVVVFLGSPLDDGTLVKVRAVKP
jgi:ribonuclease HI